MADSDDVDTLDTYLNEAGFKFTGSVDVEPCYEECFPREYLREQLALLEARRASESSSDGGSGGGCGTGDDAWSRCLRHADNTDDGLLRLSWVKAGEPCAALVIGFASLGVLDGHGVPQIKFEFVGTCKRAGATHGLFVKDMHQSWYMLGVNTGTCMADGATQSFDSLVELLRREVEALQPARLVTLGASMGGYAAIRAGLALGATAVLAFVPQVIVDPAEREAIELPHMAFVGSLRRLRATMAARALEMTSLLPSVGACTHAVQVQVHVGARESGDVREALLLREAAREAGDACAAVISVHVHARKGHLLFRDLKEAGALDELLTELVGFT